MIVSYNLETCYITERERRNTECLYRSLTYYLHGDEKIQPCS